MEERLRFVVFLQETVATAGSQVILEVTLNREHEIIWQKDGEEITFDERMKLITDGRTQSIVIEDCILDDAAEYSATIPTDISAATLVVEGIN